MQHRSDLEAFADGVRAWLRGDEGDDANAAGVAICEVLVMWREYLKAEGK